MIVAKQLAFTQRPEILQCSQGLTLGTVKIRPWKDCGKARSILAPGLIVWDVGLRETIYKDSLSPSIPSPQPKTNSNPTTAYHNVSVDVL